MNRNLVYFDYAATCPVDPRVAAKMQDCLLIDGTFGNPASRSHEFGWKADEAVEKARLHVANLVNADSREIVWTSGATESDNLAIKGAAKFYKDRGNHIITSKIEHKAVLDPCRQLEREGFEITYKNLGVSFDSYYYESDTYLLGKRIIDKGIKDHIFYKKEDGSVWIDLTNEGLDQKLLLRKDGTSVYMTQDLGTALKRLEDNPNLKGMVYTVGNEQDYHFKVLFLILKKLGFEWAQSLYHLSYGMVDLPSGKMKSREGTVVDADNLISNMIIQAKLISEEVGKLDSLSYNQRNNLYENIALGALKYFILKVDPKKSILFDPKASIDFNGNTGPFIQYTHARIKTLIKRAPTRISGIDNTLSLNNKERELIKQLGRYPDAVSLAGEQYSPAVIANYLYDLVKCYNTFYQNLSILGIKDKNLKSFRIALSQKVAEVVSNASGLLGIEVPDSM